MKTMLNIYRFILSLSIQHVFVLCVHTEQNISGVESQSIKELRSFFPDYSPESLPNNVPELRAIIQGHYPADGETRKAATLHLAQKLFEQNQSARPLKPGMARPNLSEAEALAKSLIEATNAPRALLDQAALLLIKINFEYATYLWFKNGELPISLLPQGADRDEAMNLLSYLRALFARVMLPGSTLNMEDRGEARLFWIAFLEMTEAPMENFKSAILFFIQDPELSDNVKQILLLSLPIIYEKIKKNPEIEKNPWHIAFMQEFPGGQIPQ